MIITWYGQSCFKIVNSGGQLTIITDPFDKGIGLNPPRSGADIVLVSGGDKNIGAVSGQPFIIDGPGEYVIKGINIEGILGFSDEAEKQLNTIYALEVDGVRICHLGSLGQKELTDKQVEMIGQIDILIVPVGGKGYSINAVQAVKIVEQIEPRLIIPARHKLPGLKIDLDDVSKFLGEMGRDKQEAVDKLNLKKKDLSGEKAEIALMKP